MKLFKKIVGMFLFLTLGITSCKEEVEIKNSLSVSPDTALEFYATGNESVTFTVTTDAEKWTYTTSEWITAEQNGNTLVVNVEDNSGEARTGSISFTAGTADQVKINVLQHEPGADSGVGECKVAGFIKDESGDNDVKITLDDTTNSTTVKLKLTTASALQSDANVSVSIDEGYLNEYNYVNGTSCVILPNDALTATEWPVTIAGGTTETELSIEINGANLEYVSKYLLPLKVNVVSGDVAFANASSRVNYVITKVYPKDIKQMCIMEFNDANPLNVLEYKLEDGSYFFDALVLFSGNMGWDADTESVRFNARTGEPVINKNTDALTREWETYLKPIHDAGIKVYMGIMPHHTRAGISTLSYNGCKWFAEEMAQIIKDCQMDGVFLDEEYVGTEGGFMTDAWSTPVAGASYFAFQMAKQMDLFCDWPTEVAVYQYTIGSGWTTVTDHEDSSFSLTPAEYADIMVADYGKKATPCEGQTLKNCTGASLQLNYGDTISESDAKQVKEDGYGWMMYFALNPDPNHSNYTSGATETFKNVARGCYEQELVEPTHYYKKIGEGVYDPTRYAY